MNNNEQKNIHYSLSACSQIPHPDGVEVGSAANGFKSSSVNNQLQKLIDNDLWTQNRVKEMSQKEFGPKRYDRTKVDAAPNGYKTYDFSEVVDELVVMRKVETAPGDTLEKVWSGAKVRCMYNYGNTFFVGTEQGLMYTRDGEIYTGIDFGEDDEDDEDDQNQPEVQTADSADGQETSSDDGSEDEYEEGWDDDPESVDEESTDGVFDVYAAGGRIFVAAGDDGVFEVTQDTSGYPVKYGLTKLNQNDLPACRCVYYRPAMKEIYVGTADGVWRAIYTGGPQKFYKVSYTGELRANSFFKLSADNVNVFTYDDMLVASDQGLLSSGRADGLQRLVEYYEFPHTESMAEVAGRTAFLKDDGFCTVEDGCLAVDPSGPVSQTDDGVLIPAGMNLVSAYMSTEGGVELATLDVSGVESDILQVLCMGFRNDNRIIYLRTSSAVYSYDINMRVAKWIIGPVDDMKSGGMVYLRNGGTLSASTPGRETVSEYPQVMSYFRVQGYENSGVFKIIQRGGERVFVSPGKLYVLSDGRQSQIEISTIDRPGCKIADFQALPEGTTVNGKTWSYSAALADGAGGCFVRLYGDFRDGVQYADSEPVRLAGAIEQAVACGVTSGIVYLATNYGFYYQDTSGNAFGAFTKLSETLPTLAGAGAAAGGTVAYSAQRQELYKIQKQETLLCRPADPGSFGDGSLSATDHSGRRIAPLQFFNTSPYLLSAYDRYTVLSGKSKTKYMFGSFTGWAASIKKPNLVEYSDHSYGAFLEYGAGLSSTVNYVRLSAANAAVLAVDRLPATPPATDVFISVARPDIEDDNDISDDNIQHLTDPYEKLSVHVWPATAEGVQHYVIYPSISCFRYDIFGIKNGSVDYSVTSQAKYTDVYNVFGKGNDVSYDWYSVGTKKVSADVNGYQRFQLVSQPIISCMQLTGDTMYGDQAVYTFDKYVESFEDGFISTLTANSYHRNITVNLPDDYMDKVADRQQEYWVFWYQGSKSVSPVSKYMPISSNADGTVKVGKVSGYFSDTIHSYSNCVVSSFMSSNDNYNYVIYLCNSVKIVPSGTGFDVTFPAGRHPLNNEPWTDKNQNRHIGMSGLNAYYSVKNQFDEYYSYGTFAVLSVQPIENIEQLRKVKTISVDYFGTDGGLSVIGGELSVANNGLSGWVPIKKVTTDFGACRKVVMDYPAAFCLFDGINTEDKHIDKGLYYKFDVLSGETSAGWTFVNNGVSWLDEKFDIDIVADSMDNDDSQSLSTAIAQFGVGKDVYEIRKTAGGTDYWFTKIRTTDASNWIPTQYFSKDDFCIYVEPVSEDEDVNSKEINMLCATYGVKLGNYDSYLMSCDQAQASAIADAAVVEAEGTEAAKAAKTVKDGLWTDYLAISAQYYGLCAIVNDYDPSDPESGYTSDEIEAISIDLSRYEDNNHESTLLSTLSSTSAAYDAAYGVWYGLTQDMWDPAYRAAEVSGAFCWNDIDMKVVRRITGVSGFLGKSDMSFFQTPENQISCTVQNSSVGNIPVAGVTADRIIYDSGASAVYYRSALDGDGAWYSGGSRSVMLASADVELDDFETIGMTHYAAGAGTLSSCRFAETVSYPLEFRASCDISAVSSVVMNGLAGGNGVMAASFDPDADIGGIQGAWRVSAVVPDASAPGGLSVSPPLSSALSTTEFYEVVPFQDGQGMLARTDLEGNFAWIRQDGPGPVFPVRETGCSAARATDSDVYMAFGEKVLEFGGTGRVETLTPIPTSIKLSCHRICDAPGGGLVTTTSGLYRLKQDRYGVRVSPVGGMSSDAVGAVCQYGFSGGGFVYCDAAGRTLSSAKGRMFDEFMNVPAKINSVYARNKNEYYFGADDGIWRTVYSYELSNDTKVFTAQDVKVEYDDMTSDLSAGFEAGLSVHRETMHDGDSFATKLGRRVVGVRFENAGLDAWTNVRRNETSGFSGNNDIVFETEFGNQSGGDIVVTLSNFLTSDDSADFSYITKRWNSGVTEIYVYIPTTNTYYIAHAGSESGCGVPLSVAYRRQNIAADFGLSASVIDSDIPSHTSRFQIKVSDAVYGMDGLMEVQANGNSLPLKIYRDQTYQYAEQDSWDLYHSDILPTLVVSAPKTSADVDQYGDYIFDFACFGQDAQAVKIVFFDASAGLPTYTIRFEANGGLGQMPSQRMKLETPKRLRRSRFKWSGDQKFFAGWSFSPTAETLDVPDQAIFDWTQFQDRIGEMREGGELTLFAVWLDVGMGTELVLEI